MSVMQYQAADEEKVIIPLPGSEDLVIEGSLRGSLQSPLVVMMHGRFSNMNSVLQYLGSRYLHEHGFSTLRLNMYGYGKGTRNNYGCTLQTHADDFDTVVAYLRQQGVTRMYATGHSYGGLTILKSTCALEGAVLWDASHGLTWREPVNSKWQKPELIRATDDFVVNLLGNGSVVSKIADDYDRAMGDTTVWAAGKPYGIKFITADRQKGILTEFTKKYYDVAAEPKMFVEIPDASHGFVDSDDVLHRLLDETTQWFKKLEGR